MAQILKIERKSVTTSYGEKEKWILTIGQDGKQIMADSFIGKWNSDWHEGMEVDIKKEQWKSREYNGKTYWSIMAPPEARGGFVNPQEIAALKEEVAALTSLVHSFIESYDPMLSEIKKERGGAPIPAPDTFSSEDDGIPVVETKTPDAEDEIRIEDVPF